jgi:hypothetical protein
MLKFLDFKFGTISYANIHLMFISRNDTELVV